VGELIRRQNTKRITCIIPAKENITCELHSRRNQLKSTALAAIAYLKCCDFNRVHCSHKHRRGEWLHLPRRNNSKRRKESPLRHQRCQCTASEGAPYVYSVCSSGELCVLSLCALCEILVVGVCRCPCSVVCLTLPLNHSPFILDSHSASYTIHPLDTQSVHLIACLRGDQLQHTHI
jgi:hypothetical protein